MNAIVPGPRNESSPSDDLERPKFATLAAEALRYREPRRLLYNAVLLAVVGMHFYAAWPDSKAFLARDPCSSSSFSRSWRTLRTVQRTPSTSSSNRPGYARCGPGGGGWSC